MGPKKVQKMALGEFLADESYGTSWADEMEDMPTIQTRTTSGYGSSTRRDYGATTTTTTGSGNDRYSGYSRADDGDRFPARAAVPIPDHPPYTAHVGNLSFDVTEGEISDFFASCEVSNVRLVRDREQDRPKGFGYVEFSTRDGLLAALELNGKQLAGRNVRISVAEPAKDRGDDRTAGEWRRSGPLPALEPSQRRGYERHDREDGGHGRRQNSFREEGDGKVRDFGNWERKGPLSPLPATSPTGNDRPRGEFRRRSPAPNADGFERHGGFRERPPVERQPSAAEKDNEWRKGARPDAPQRSTPASPVIPQSRPRLELKKRSEQPVATEAPTTGSDKPNPFGGARPIDTTQREKEIEERRAAAAAARKAKEEKEREEKKAAREAEAKEKAASEAGTPVATKGFDVLRRGSGSVAGEEGEEQVKPEGPGPDRPPRGDRRAEKPQPKSPDNWRARGPGPKETPKNEGESDGWSTVTTGKRGGRGSGRAPVA
ncbi:hypothetical protein FN846DRAFT_169112 [Sphaerosporella brunnea]|uniref:RRM domain-containing protein n=1 Tax=Sphaerosporella brunnea TaxID=1250544 RepID=A0A5J5ERQ5_9PEZI|nr:hypothetical protein FN846DRAFT_169112 [Sphaerosporella brunnea]